MKIMITSSGNSMHSKFDVRFGRTSWFCVYNTENKTTEFIKNNNLDVNGGAGTKAAEEVAKMQISKVISGGFGPKAKSLLERFKIQMIALEETDLNIREIINKIK